MKISEQNIFDLLKKTANSVVPSDGKAILFGSRARGDNKTLYLLAKKQLSIAMMMIDTLHNNYDNLIKLTHHRSDYQIYCL